MPAVAAQGLPAGSAASQASEVPHRSKQFANKKVMFSSSNNNEEAFDDAENKDIKTLLISTKRPRTFLERCARELLAGQTQVIILSALGDAIPLCVNLLVALEQKKAVACIKIETSYTPYTTGGVQGYTPGLRIYVKKHENFKGSRISPGYVFFCDDPAKVNNLFTQCYEPDSLEGFASVNAGDSELYVGGAGINKAFADILKDAGQNIELYTVLHERLLKRALEENKDGSENETRFIIMDDLTNTHPDVEVALCRPCMELSRIDQSGRTGCVFISTFKDKYPCNSSSNVALVYVVGPKGSDFVNKEDFIFAVQATAGNLMTALCDFNGFVRRQGKNMYPRINLCRICLFSGGKYIHRDASKMEVAQAILSGLNEAYRHGPAPRLNFTYDEDVFKKTWAEVMGFEVFQSNVNNGKIIAPKVPRMRGGRGRGRAFRG